MTDPLKVIASCVRGMLVASPGKELIAIDYAGIESRIVAWVSGDTRKLAVFERYDRGEGPNNYIMTGAQILQQPVESIKKGSVLYMLSKIVELAMGFEGGVGALAKAFSDAEAQTGLSLEAIADLCDGKLHPEAMKSAQWMYEKGYLNGHGLSKRVLLTLDALKAAWRMAHQPTANRQDGAWKQLKDAATMAIQNPGKAYTIDTKLVTFQVKDRWLYMRLPSGRCIVYFKPRIEYEKAACTLCTVDTNVDCPECGGKGHTEHSPSIRYMGVDTEKRIWTETATYGGKIMQNVTEGIGRDLLVHGMQNLERTGLNAIMCVHDEAVMEMPKGAMTLEEGIKAFLARPAWSVGLPLAAEGFVGQRFKK